MVKPVATPQAKKKRADPRTFFNPFKDMNLLLLIGKKVLFLTNKFDPRVKMGHNRDKLPFFLAPSRRSPSQIQDITQGARADDLDSISPCFHFCYFFQCGASGL